MIWYDGMLFYYFYDVFIICEGIEMITGTESTEGEAVAEVQIDMNGTGPEIKTSVAVA
jgi:hypothetical protein